MIEVKENETQRALFIDGVCQGVSDKSGKPLSPYMQFVMEHIKTMKPFSDCLFLGGGAMLLPMWAKKEHGMNITVFENDPDVYEKAKENFHALGLGPVVFIVDARLFNGYLSYQQRYQFIFLDVWPHHGDLYNDDYIRSCAERLTAKGTFAVNFCSQDSEKISEFGKMLAGIFKNVKMRLIAMDQEMKHPAQAVFFCDNI